MVSWVNYNLQDSYGQPDNTRSNRSLPLQPIARGSRLPSRPSGSVEDFASLHSEKPGATLQPDTMPAASTKKLKDAKTPLKRLRAPAKDKDNKAIFRAVQADVS